MVSGPRQVGKSTLLKRTLPKVQYVTLDDPELRNLARSEPKVFLDLYKPPVIIDEIQYAPELFPILKMKVDDDQRPGQYWLSGSQAFEMMKNVTESLAGRVAISISAHTGWIAAMAIDSNGHSWAPSKTHTVRSNASANNKM